MFFGGASMALAGAWIQQQRTLGAGQLDIDGDCAAEPAAEKLLFFATADFPKLSQVGVHEMSTPIGWEPAQGSELGPFLSPPEWSVINAWANTFASDGTPEWQQQPLPYPFWSATMVVAPDERALYMHVSGGVDNVYLSAQEATDIARVTVLGPDARLRPVCTVGQHGGGPDLGTVDWVSADRHRSNLLLTRGWGIQSDVSGPSLGPGTQFGFDAMVAPRREADRYMVDVFLRILWQFVPRGSGGDSTPTPTPAP